MKILRKILVISIKNYKEVGAQNLTSGKYLFTKDHIIYSKIRPNLNKVALPDFDGLCSADAYPLLVNKNNTNRYFFAYILRSKYFLNNILKLSDRTNIPKVNKDQLRSFECICPPIELQKEFSRRVEAVEKLKAYTKPRWQNWMHFLLLSSTALSGGNCNMSAVPPFPEGQIEALARLLGECGSGDDISRVISNRGLVDKSRQSTKWRRLYWVFLDCQQQHGCANQIIDFIQSFLAPARFAERNDEFEANRQHLNTILSFSGLEYGKDGRVPAV